jgi:hypothetical protein
MIGLRDLASYSHAGRPATSFASTAASHLPTCDNDTANDQLAEKCVVTSGVPKRGTSIRKLQLIVYRTLDESLDQSRTLDYTR